MDNLPIRVEFDASIDDFVDVQLRYVKSSKTFRDGRRGSLVVFGLFGGVSASLIASLDTGATMGTVGAHFILGTVAGVVVGLFFRDQLIRSRVRRAVQEHLSLSESTHCIIELRPDQAWARNAGHELAFDWDQATGIVDTGDAIEMQFKGGIIVARNRAFATTEARATFFEQAKALAGIGPRS